MTDFEENKEIAREIADMVGNELMDMEGSINVILMVAYMLMEDYIKIIRSSNDIMEESSNT